MSVDLTSVRSLAVLLHDRPVGVISRLAGDKQVFLLDQDYVEDRSRPTLSLSLKTPSGGVLTAIRPVHRRVPAFFSNLLPEGHLRTYLAQQAGVNPEREFFVLAALGEDLPGAVRVVPLDDAGQTAELEDASPPTRRGRGRRAGVLRFSLAGVQLKFSAVMESSGGLTIPAHGVGGSWIVKLPSPRFPDASENEFAMLELARAVGITVPRTKLVPVSAIDGLPAAAGLKGKALAVERFDRGPRGQRIHIEDFAQVFAVYPESKYKKASYSSIARVLWAEAGERSVSEFLRRVVFSVLIGNADMHLKNWSLIYRDGRTPELSPAYDFVSTLPYLPEDELALSFGGTKDIHQITPDQLRRYAAKAGMAIPMRRDVVPEMVEEVVTAWRTLEAKKRLPAGIRKAITRHMESVARQTLVAFSESRQA